jgi:monoamine oxidase
MNSIWTETVRIPGRNPLPGNRRTEVVVIGAGMAGILTAFYLQRHGVHVVVLEADRIGSGQSGYTTAKITSQHNLIYGKLVKTAGETPCCGHFIGGGHTGFSGHFTGIGHGGLSRQFIDPK